MRVLRMGFLVALCTAITFAAAQAKLITPVNPIIITGEWILFDVNEISDAGFESTSSSPWNETGSYIYTSEGDMLSEGFGFITTSHHSGSRGYDFNVGEGPDNGFFNSVLNQTLSSPVSGGSINNGSVWVFAESQTLGLSIEYNDGTQTYTTFSAAAANALPGNNGWQQWNFTSAINPNKTVIGIQFSAGSGFGSDILIDDVALDVFEWIWI